MRNTNHIVSRGLLGLVALAALGIAAPAHADVIYNNFGPGDSFSQAFGYAILGSSYGDLDWAGTFTTGADGYNNIVFEGAFLHAAGTPGVTMRLMGDAGGLPNEGVVLDTSSSPLVPIASPGSILTWTLNPTVTLTANTRYWFAASITHPDGGGGWMANNTGYAGIARGNANWGFFTNSPSPAFRVSGSALGGGAVPEPSEWAAMGVLGLALGGLIVRKRRAR